MRLHRKVDSMKIIRDSVFETNSSSTHAIVIPHKVHDDNYSLNDSLNHEYQFERGAYTLVSEWDEKLAYVYYVLEDQFSWLKDKDSEEACSYRKVIVTENDLQIFRDKINRIYNKLKKKYKVYSHRGLTPDDIFNLIRVERVKSDNWSFIKEENKAEEIVNKTFSKDVLERLESIFPSCMSSSRYPDDVYVDHTEDFDTNGFIEKVLNADENFLKRFIFNKDSYITVGSDEYSGYYIKTIGFQYDYCEEDFPQDNYNEAGEKCPDRDQFKDFDEWWKVQENYPVIKDNGGFWDKLSEYEKDNDVFLKGN